MNQENANSNNCRRDAFESFEIEREHEDRSSERRYRWPTNIRTSQYVLLALLIVLFLTWQFQVAYRRPSSGVFCATTEGDLCGDDDDEEDENVAEHWSSSDLDNLWHHGTNKSRPQSKTKGSSFNLEDHDGLSPYTSPTKAPSPQPSFRGVFFNDEVDLNDDALDEIDDVIISEESIDDEKIQPTKYLLYFTESGWANQEVCLEHAYFIARALNRTLILPPVLPHLGKGSTLPRDVFGMDSGNFKTYVDPLKYYIKKLPKKKYLPISEVLDLKYSLPAVSTIDAKLFGSQEDVENMSRWVMEYNYSHFNTEWIHNCPDLEGKITSRTHREYGTTRFLNMTFRDIIGTLGNHKADILVMLDGFKSMFHTSAESPPIRPRLSYKIREVAKSIRDSWQVPAYASVHIRGGDGPFQKEEKFHHTITTTLNGILNHIVDWLGNQTTKIHEIDTVGLYVATDVRDLFNHTVMTEEANALVDRIFSSTGVMVELLSGEDIRDNITEATDGMRYAGIFIDVQMAACGTIGFVGTEGSTFSKLIQNHQHESSC